MAVGLTSIIVLYAVRVMGPQNILGLRLLKALIRPRPACTLLLCRSMAYLVSSGVDQVACSRAWGVCVGRFVQD